MGLHLHWALPQVLGRLRATSTEQTACAQLHTAMRGSLFQYRHGGEVAHPIGCHVPLLVTSELVQR